jgi:hypothetical protein
MNDANDNCFECGSIVELHRHHIIPRSLGGKKTIRLCGKCHGLIHGLNFTNHSILIKKSLEKLKRDGIKLGRPKGISMKREQICDNLLEKHPDIHLCLLDNISIRKIAKHTGKGISTVQRVKKAYDEKN